MKRHWYAQKAGNDTQGMVVEEETGRTVAVAYDRKDMDLLAAAPRLLEQLTNCLRLIEDEGLDELHGDLAECIRDVIETSKARCSD